MENYSNNLYETFCTIALASPESTAVIHNEMKLSYSEFYKEILYLSSIMSEGGIQKGSLVAVHVKRSHYLPIILFALLRVGAVYFPVDLQSPTSRLKMLFKNSLPDLVICDEEFYDKFHEYLGPITTTKSLQKNILWDKLSKPHNHFKNDDIGYLIYTSGSTGQPKGVLGSSKGLANRINWMRNCFNVLPSDRILLKTPINFDVSLWELILPFVSGACLVVLDENAHLDPEQIYDNINRHKIDIIHFVPPMLDIFLKYIEEKDVPLPIIRVFASGDILPDNLANKFYKLCSGALYNLYGPTEASIDVTYHKCFPNSQVSIGKPIDNVSIHILDNNMNPCAVDQVGEIFISGISLAHGYYKNDLETKKHFIKNPFFRKSLTTNKADSQHLYKTGDTAMYLQNGEIKFLGRIDNQIKIRGIRVELSEIEKHIYESELVEKSLVLVDSIDELNKKIIAAIIPSLKHANSLVVKKIKKHLSKQLPQYMRPNMIILLDDFPLLPNGKVDRKKIIKETRSFPPKSSNSAVQDVENESFNAVFKEVLMIDKVEMEKNFYELGGDSILAMKIFLHLRKTYGDKVTIKKILTSSSLNELLLEII